MDIKPTSLLYPTFSKCVFQEHTANYFYSEYLVLCSPTYMVPTEVGSHNAIKIYHSTHCMIVQSGSDTTVRYILLSSPGILS